MNLTRIRGCFFFQFCSMVTNNAPYNTQAVDESLRNVNLFRGGVADRSVGKYSGGMKRRLSVAMALIGNPKVL
jgi:ABC-type multidrug transport system ATPase subunit